MTTDAEFIEQINTLKVSAQLLGEVTLIWASLPPEIWNDFDRRLEQVLDYVGKTRNDPDAPMVAMAAALRLMALDMIVKDPETRAWLVPGSYRGFTYIHGDLLAVAAAEMLHEGEGGDPVFDPASFRDRLMELLAAKGQA